MKKTIALLTTICVLSGFAPSQAHAQMIVDLGGGGGFISSYDGDDPSSCLSRGYCGSILSGL